MKLRRPEPTEHAPYFSRYIDLVPEEDVCAALEQQASETARLLASIPEERSAFRYAPEKWSVRQLVGHVADAERVFAYRALCIARGERKSLPGFDENEYAAAGAFDSWGWKALQENLAVVRRATLLLLRNLPEEAWDRRGIANDNPATVRSIAFSTLGHERHHLRILRERYLKAT